MMRLSEITHPDRRVERACRRYARSLNAGMNQRRCDGDVREQVRRYEETAIRHSLIETQVRELLDRRDISLRHALTYDNFAKRVARVLRDHGGRTRLNLVKLAFDQWLEYGCELAVLSEICRTVFDYDITAPGPEETAPAQNDEVRSPNDESSPNDQEGK
jgi:hypothetical protein